MKTTVGVTEYTNLAPQKCCGKSNGRTNGQSGPTTRPAFAKATQVKRNYLETMLLFRIQSSIF